MSKLPKLDEITCLETNKSSQAEPNSDNKLKEGNKSTLKTIKGTHPRQ